MAKWLEQASQWHEMYRHDLEVMSSNPARLEAWVELGVCSTVLSRTWAKHIMPWVLFGFRCIIDPICERLPSFSSHMTIISVRVSYHVFCVVSGMYWTRFWKPFAWSHVSTLLGILFSSVQSVCYGGIAFDNALLNVLIYLVQYVTDKWQLLSVCLSKALLTRFTHATYINIYQNQDHPRIENLPFKFWPEALLVPHRSFLESLQGVCF